MLTESDKEKIRLEEQYRLEIRNQLQVSTAKQSVRSKLWALLNSSFILWLLSAIVITGAGALYTNYQNSRSEKLKNEDLVNKLDWEIGYRYSQILIRLYDLTDKKPQGPALAKDRNVEDVRKVLELLNQQPSVTFASLYLEFSNVGLPALISEQERHLQRIRKPNMASRVKLIRDETTLRLDGSLAMKISQMFRMWRE